jgi:hypothetical protein
MRHNPPDLPPIKIQSYMKQRAQTLKTLVSGLEREANPSLIGSVEDAMGEVKQSIDEIELAVLDRKGRLTPAPRKALNEYKDLVERAQKAVDDANSGKATRRFISEADVDAIGGDDEGGSAPEWGGAVLLQLGFTAEFETDDSDPSFATLSGIATEVAERISDYVEREDISADYTIDFNVGRSLRAKRNDYTILVTISQTSKADKVLEKIAPLLVAIFDEMDPDFDDDVVGFLMDV